MKAVNKLTLEQLAPYLPYELKVFINGEIRDMICSPLPCQAKGFINICVIPSSGNCKPILRPLSDLTKTKFQFEYGEPMTLEDWINGNSDFDSNWILKDIAKEQRQERIQEIPYFAIKQLFKYHFDVFGGIEQGLAIDINTLK